MTDLIAGLATTSDYGFLRLGHFGPDRYRDSAIYYAARKNSKGGKAVMSEQDHTEPGESVPRVPFAKHLTFSNMFLTEITHLREAYVDLV